MRILITGGTGLLGKTLIPLISNQGHKIIILSRNKKRAQLLFSSDISVYEWDPLHELPPSSALKDLDVVINLMGENIISKKWTQKQKKIIFESRVIGVRNLAQGIRKIYLNNPNQKKVAVFIQASATGIYLKDLEIKRSPSQKEAHQFLFNVCQEWEKEARNGSIAHRCVIFRWGVILSKQGGIVKKLLPIFKWGFGGIIGDGKTMMSWIHIYDACRLILQAIQDSKMQGVYNAVTGQACSNKQFTKALAKSLHRWALFPVPSILIKWIYGEGSTVILDSLTVEPKKLQKINFKFKYSDIQEALDDIC